MAQDTLERLRERFEASRSDRAAFEAIEEHLFVRGEWAPLVTLYEDRLEADDLDPAKGDAARRTRASVVLRLGQVLEERRIDPEGAIARYREVLDLQPDHRLALQQLRGLYERREDWESLLDVAAREAELPMSPPERARLCVELGLIHEDRLEQPEEALGWFRQALEQVPDEVDALLGSARIHTQQGETDAAKVELEQASSRLQGPDRAAALVAWAALMGPDEAERQETMYRSALEDEPRSEPALEALCRLTQERGEWEAFDDFCERRFSVGVGAVRRLAVVHDAARSLLGPARNPRAARRWLERALELFPGDPLVHFQLADCEGLAGNPAAREPHLRMGWELAGEATPLDVLRECAELATEREDFEEAARDLEALIEREGPTARSVEQLERVLERAGRDDALLPTLIQRAEGLEGEASADVWMRVAGLHEAKGDVDAAREARERALEQAPAHESALAATESGLREDERHDELAIRLETAWNAADPASDEALSIALRLAELQGEVIGDSEAAHATYTRILESHPDELRARQGLERMVLASGDTEAIARAFERELEARPEPERARFLALELARLHAGEERPQDALAALSLLAEQTDEDAEVLALRADLEAELERGEALLATLRRLDPMLSGREQAAVRLRIAGLLDEREDATGALEAHRAALESDPEDLASLRRMEERLDAAGEPRALADVRTRLARLLPLEERAACRLRLAIGQEESLGDLPAAIATLEDAADDPGAPAEVAERLERLLGQTGRDDELCVRLERRRSQLPVGDPEGEPEARALDRRRAELLLDRLDRPAEAADLYQALFDGAPDDEAAELETRLEQALRGARRLEALESLLARRSEASEDEAERAALDLERARLLIERGGHEADAAALLEPLAYGATAEAADAHRELTRVLERSGDSEALRRHLERGLSEGADDAERLALHERLAGLCRDHLRDATGAAEHLSAATRLAPERVDLWQALQRLHLENDRPEALLDAYEGELAGEPSLDRRRWLLAHAMDLARSLGDDERLEPHVAAILELDPAHPDAFEHRVARLEAAGDLAEIARLLEARIDAFESSPDEGNDAPSPASELLSLRLRLAALLAGELDEPERAIGLLEPLAEGERLPLVAEPLAELLERTGRPEALAPLAERAAQDADDADERASWWRRLAEARRATGDLSGSAEAQRRVLAERPEDARARSALRELYAELEEVEPLARLLELELADAGGSEEVGLRLELAAILRDRLDRPDEALSHLERALRLDPAQGDTIESGLALAEQLGRDESWLSLSELALSRQPGSQRRAELLRGQAERLRAQTPDDAIARLREAVRATPGDVAGRRALREALEAEGDTTGWLQCVEEEVASLRDADPEAAAELCAEAARRAESEGGGERALPWLLRLRALRSDDATVLARISEVHRAAGRRVDLLRALDAELALTPPMRRRTELFLERASLLAESGARDAALASLEQARATSPESDEVLGRLDALLSSEGRLLERAEVLASRIATASGNERHALRRELIDCERERGNPRGAARAVWLLLGESEATGVARSELLGELGGLLLEAGDEPAWAAVAEAELADLSSDTVFDERRRFLHRDLARLWSRHTGRPGLARAHWAALLDGGLVAPDGDEAELFAEAEAGLLDALRRSGDVVELESRLAERLDRKQGEPAPDLADAWIELGRLRLERLQRPAAAAAAFRQAARCEPTSVDAVRGLRAASERLSRMHDVAETLDRELELTPEAETHPRAALLRRLGEVVWHELSDTPRACAAFEAALAADERDLKSLRALSELAESSEDHEGAAARYAQELGLLGDAEPERRSRLWIRRAELARDHQNDPAAAIEAFAEADRAAPISLGRRREWAELLADADDHEGFARVFAPWCDAEDTQASGIDLLRLAQALHVLEDAEQAERRAQDAAALEPGLCEAHDLVAELASLRGDAAEASEALERAADAVSGPAAAERRIRAAEWVESEDPERAFALAFRASVDDPAYALGQACLARIALARSQYDVAEAAAAQALELDDGGFGEALRLATALGGAEASHARGRSAERIGFLEEALRQSPAHPEALAALGEARFAVGDLKEARQCLSRRLELDEPDPDRARHLAQLGACLVASDDVEAAITRFREALEQEPELDEAHAGLAGVLEASAESGPARRRKEAVEALEAWAERAEDGETRAERLLRAAKLEVGSRTRAEAAERLLRASIEAAPALPGAYDVLSELLEEQGRLDDAHELAESATDVVTDEPTLAALARVSARALLARDDSRGAAACFEKAGRLDPSDAESALEAARLMRGLGEWRHAAEVLQRYADGAESSAPEQAAPVLCQLGRLLAGPLEDLAGAVSVYRRALAIDAELPGGREALAAILVHLPEHWDEAVACHAELLEEDPTRAASLRALVQIAQGRERTSLADAGLSLLCALGAGTQSERAKAPSAPAALLAGRGHGLGDPLFDCAREIAQEAADEIAEALETGGAGATAPGSGASPIARFRAAAAAREGQLAAPALVPLPAEQIGSVIALTARIALSTGTVQGDGHLVNALSASLSRRARKRVKRVLGERSPETLADLDALAFRVALRAEASLVALEQGEGDLRSALLAWALDDDSEPVPAEEADISARVGDSPEARGVLVRLVERFVAESRSR
ncbi:MAG: tetratricopeptide repeat protein [Myxococcota bacterium]|nr:tetratricopeptide repeat protein [Myxococcota bacterium]